MKSFSSPKRSVGIIEPLEARIAPATIRIGAIGVSENITDTEYREAVDPTNPQTAPRPDPFNLISFIDTSNATDPISLAVDPSRTADGTNTFFLRLNAGDEVDHFTAASSYRPLITVTKGHVVAFFTDINNNNEYDDGELTGISLGAKTSVEIDGRVNGDIVTNLNEHGTNKVSDDTVDMNSLVSVRQKIASLKVLGGSVNGNVLSGGDINAITIAGNVDNVLAGTAAVGTAFHFFRAPNSGTGLAGLSIAPGQTGASINNATIQKIGNDTVQTPRDRLEAGGGGAGGLGGSLNNIQITSDTDGFQLLAGKGGTADVTVGQKNGGTGGLVTSVFVTGLEDPSPNSPQGVVIKAGAGGDGLSNKRGGNGGKLSKVYVGYESVGDAVVTSGELGADSVLLASGDGGAGKTGGKAGGVGMVKIRVRTLDVRGGGDEISVLGGLGGSSLSPGGKAGKGGSIADVDIRNQILSPDSDILVKAGTGGTTTTVGDSIGGKGGSVSKLTLLGFDIQLVAGNGTRGLTGGAGGSVTEVTVLPDEFILTRNLLINAGNGGEGTAGNGGNGGVIDNVNASQVDLQQLLINSGSVAAAPGINPADGGASNFGKGGRGGKVTNVQVTDIDGEASVIEGTAEIRAGRGGDGTFGGKPGGGFDTVGISGHALSLKAFAGDGGSALFDGKGGAGGGFKVFNFVAESTVNGLDASGAIRGGKGGNGLGPGKTGGAGGGSEKVNLNFSGDVSLIAGSGGNGQARGAGVKAGAAGAGGSVISSGIFAGPSVDVDPLTNLPVTSTQSSAEIRAGNAGELGGRPANGGNVTGDPEPEVVDGVPVPALLVGVRAENNVTVVAGNGSHGGKGGNIRNMAYGSTNSLLVPTPVGNILVQGGDGSSEGRFGGRGGVVDGISGSVSSIPVDGIPAGTTLTTKILGGKGGGGVGSKVAGKGGGVSHLALTRGGGAGVVITIQAGDAGDAAPLRIGAKGGSVNVVGISNLDDLTILRDIGAGDGGDAGVTGGKGGGVFNVKVEGHDIGVRTGETYGYDHMGGVFAGVGGSGSKKGKSGNVDQVSADAIAAIVAGRGRVPELANVVSNIYVNGGEGNLLLTRNNALVPNGEFRLNFDGQSTALLPAGATAAEVKAALNGLTKIAAAGGVEVEVTLNGGYRVTFSQNGNRVALSGVEQVIPEVLEATQGSVTNLTAVETTPGLQTLLVEETRSGQDAAPAVETTPGTSSFSTTETRAADDVLLIDEIQLLDVSYLATHQTGKFQLTFGDDPTDPANTTPLLASDATAAEIEAALNALPLIAAVGGVTVTDAGAPRAFNVEFGTQTIPDYQDQPPISGLFFVQEVQNLDVQVLAAFPTGKFSLTYQGATTPLLANNIGAVDLQTALNNLTTIAADGRVTVARPVAGIYDITFNGIGDKPPILGDTFVQEAQTITLGSFAGAPAGAFTISLGGVETTIPLPPNATADQVRDALKVLPSVIAAGGVTVTPSAGNGFLVVFGNVGEQLAFTAVGLLPEVQKLNLSTVTAVDTGEFTLRVEHLAAIRETIKGSTITIPTATTLAGVSRSALTTTLVEGVDDLPTPLPNGTPGSLEQQFIDLLPVVSATGQFNGEFTLTFRGERTVFLSVSATAGQVATALNALPAIVAAGGVTVTTATGAANAYNVMFIRNGNVPQITGDGGIREEQTINTSSVAALPGGEMFFALDGLNNGVGTEFTPPIPSNSNPGAIDTNLDTLPSVNLPPPGRSGVTVTATNPNQFKVKFNDFGDVPQILGRAGGTINRESVVLNLDQFAGIADANFTLTFNGSTTDVDPATAAIDPLPINASAAQVMAALNALPTIKATRTDNSGAVAVTKNGNIFNIAYNIFGDQPGLVGLVKRGDGNTPRIQTSDVNGNRFTSDQIATAIDAALESVKLTPADIAITDAKNGAFQIAFAELGDQPILTAVNYVHEKQRVDVFQVGDFQLSFNKVSTPPLPSGASAAVVQAELNKLSSIQATGKTVTVRANPDSSYSVVFGADGDQLAIEGLQTEGVAVATSVDGSAAAREIQVLNLLKKGAFQTLFYTSSARLLGAITDINEIDSNVFKSFADTNGNGIYDPGVDTLHIGAFVLGDVPIDGLVMAKTFDQVTTNVTPEAKFTAAGFFDNDNIL